MAEDKEKIEEQQATADESLSDTSEKQEEQESHTGSDASSEEKQKEGAESTEDIGEADQDHETPEDMASQDKEQPTGDDAKKDSQTPSPDAQGERSDEPEKIETGGISEEDKELLASSTVQKEQELVGPAAADSEEAPSVKVEEEKEEVEQTTHIFALRTTANREDQVLGFVSANAARKKLPVHAVIAPHGMRGYIFVESDDRLSAETAASGVPYAKGILPKEIEYKEIEHMLEQVKKDVDIRKNDIVEIISGPFKRESAKITRVDKAKEEVVVELLEAAVPIPITLKMDDVKVIRRDEREE